MSQSQAYPSYNAVDPVGYAVSSSSLVPAIPLYPDTSGGPPLPPPKPGSFPPIRGTTGPPLPLSPQQSTQTWPSNMPTVTPTQRETPYEYPGGPTPPATEEQWVPNILRDKSKSDLEILLNTPALLSALISAPSSTHPSIVSSERPLLSQLQTNISLAQHVLSLESQIQSLRSSLAPSLLRVSALERQFRAKQEEMDDALSPWAPKAVHQRLGQGVQEQEAWCRAMEESFLEGGGDAGSESNGRAGDREVAEWVRRYREGRKVLELRRERKCRLEEGRVGGWR